LKVKVTSHGLARTGNGESEDCFDAKSWDETVVAALADGLGASRNGKEAAAKIVRSLLSNYKLRPRSWSAQKALLEFARLGNRALYLESLNRYEAPEMVSTLCAAVIEGNKLHGLNVGDSRVYVWHGGNLTQLSHDDIGPDEATRHVLERAIGLHEEVEPHYFERDLADGDVVLLCSDGVTNCLDAHRLQALLSERATARSIVAAAREAATAETLDDASAVVLDVIETGKLKAAGELPLTIPDKLEKGVDVDGYRLLKPLGPNNRVWLAERAGERSLLKFAPREARDDEQLLNLFLKEQWNAVQLEAEYFVRASVPGDATQRYYVLEYLEAPSLRRLLTTRRLEVDEAIALGKFLLAAAQFLVRRDLAHGDIKPENVLVRKDGDTLQFKLVDMGNVCEMFTVTTRAGTPSYLAPERFHDAPVCERTEIFAIGVTLYQGLTGAYPYGEIEPFQTPHFRPPKNPTQLNPNVPPWLEAVILRALASEPERRQQHYSEMRYELETPDQVQPFHRADETLLERNPVLFYKIALAVMVIVNLSLLIKLLNAK
jgi:serine/threonine protein phosphatase PrpC